MKSFSHGAGLTHRKRNTMNTIVTADLSSFGYRELQIASELLDAYANGTNDTSFLTDGITLNMNTNSGYVFLSDEDMNVAMINDETEKLEQFFSCPQCGNEGFNTEYPFTKNNGYCSKKCKKQND